jgi:hypothetical protein
MPRESRPSHVDFFSPDVRIVSTIRRTKRPLLS